MLGIKQSIKRVWPIRVKRTAPAFGIHTASNIAAIPIPPAVQIEIRPRFLPLFERSFPKVPAIRAPVAVKKDLLTRLIETLLGWFFRLFLSTTTRIIPPQGTPESLNRSLNFN